MINPQSVDLTALPFLPLTDRKLLPEVPAIYFAIDQNNVIQYIGRSVNLKQRWVGHHRYRQLEKMSGIKLVWLEISDVSLLTTIEEVLIDFFDPILNSKLIKVYRSSFRAKGKAKRSVRRRVYPSRKMFCRLAVLMAEKDPQLSQRQLAEDTGLGLATVNRLFTNKFTRVDTNTVETLCNYFGRDIGELFEMREPELFPKTRIKRGKAA
ncbi:MAG: helix-turn-helix domain-containing protein [Crinalium sp.]